MEQLIIKLEAKINQLTDQLQHAHKKIEELEGQQQDTHTEQSPNSSMDLLRTMTSKKKKPINNQQDTEEQPIEYQLDFGLLHENTETNPLTNQTEQINIMTTQQPEADIQESTTDSSASQQETTNNQTTLTAEQRKRQKNQKNNRRLIKMLEERYPKAFDWNQPKPLKVGIDKDMTLDEDFNASKQKRALAAYTRSDRYKKCLLSGQPRIDLEGVAVSDEPALPESMTKPKQNRPAKAKSSNFKNKQPSHQAKEQTNKKAVPKKASPKKQDDAYSDLSPEDRMKAKLEKLLNK